MHAMPRFSANLSMLFAGLPVSARVQAAADAGFAAVEVQFPYADGLDTWRDALVAARLPLVLFNVPAGDLMRGGDGLAGVPGREREFAAALEQAAQWARALRPRCINVLAGRQPAGVPREQCLAVLDANLHRAVEVLAPLGVTVTVEAINPVDMPHFLVDSFAAMRDVVAAVPGTRMQFDIFHMARCGEPVEALLLGQGASFGHVQFADVPGRHEPGSGELDFDSLFAALDSSGYEGWCGAEYRPRPAADTASLGWLRGRQPA
jgi:hydroxypyruvate isomerase